MDEDLFSAGDENVNVSPVEFLLNDVI